MNLRHFVIFYVQYTVVWTPKPVEGPTPVGYMLYYFSYILRNIFVKVVGFFLYHLDKVIFCYFWWSVIWRTLLLVNYDFFYPGYLVRLMKIKWPNRLIFFCIDLLLLLFFFFGRPLTETRTTKTYFWTKLLFL
jgi:hypothetical protein